MRDLLLLLILAPACLVALRHPYVGAVLWAWVGTMNPHRLTYGFMFNAPVALMIGVCTLLGMLATSEKRQPFLAPPMTWLTLFIVWMCLTTAMAFYPADCVDQLEKVLKIDLMIFITVMVVRTRREIILLVWVLTLSLAYYGFKGGIFTLTSGGSSRVYGPPDSYINENNALAVALIMTVPMLRFLQTTLQRVWQKQVMTGLMVLCGISILGSQSRGALLGVSAMLVLLWWRGKAKVMSGLVMGLAAVAMLSFMPDSWWGRMHTLETYDEDQSATGRLNAWLMALNIAKSNLFGGGFSIYSPAVYAAYAPDPTFVVTAHSIYFHAIGEHGFIGFAIFIGMWLSVWTSCSWLRKNAVKHDQTKWAAELGGMIQVSFVGYWVGGAFLSLAYYDLPYNLLAIAVVTRWWVQSGAWQHEPALDIRTRVLGVPLFFGDRLVLPPRRPPSLN